MTALSTKPRTFRKDINGLRAWAVVAVILYHFGVTGFKGGFVGVDIFFVISGYLMTGIIVGGLEKHQDGKNFSLTNFYLARARRIVPALLALFIVLLALGWFWLSSEDYSTLGNHSAYALVFYSNIKFFKEAGYFDADSFEKWLLHTWSLSVEWQFYIVLPLILLMLWKIRPSKNFIIAFMSTGLLLSLSASIVISNSNTSAAFYLLPTRAWEMLAGGLVLLMADKIPLTARFSKVIELLGFALILYSIIFFSAAVIWPGYLAIVPVTGAVLVLVACRADSVLSTTAPAQWFGNTSYSLYLWHWPLVVALHYAEIQNNNLAISLALLLTALLGYVSYQLIETPARTSLNKINTKYSIILFLGVIFMVAVPAKLIKKQGGIPSRLPEDITNILAEKDNKNPRMKECHVSGSTPVPECTYGGSKLGAIVIGDSHAASLVRTIEKALPSKELHILDWSLSACSTIRGLKKRADADYRCSNFIDYILDKHKSLDNNVPIIIVNRLSMILEGFNEGEGGLSGEQPEFYLKTSHTQRDQDFYQDMTAGIVNTACELAKTRPVYMLRPTPEFTVHVPNSMARNALIYQQSTRVSISKQDYDRRHRRAFAAQDMAAAKCGIHILEPAPYLCDQQACYGDRDGLPIYYDDDHLNERGGELLLPLFKEIFSKHASHSIPTTVN